MNFNGTFRSYFGAVCVPVLDKGDGTISTVTHDWANSAAAMSGGLAVTVMRLQIANYRVDIAKERLAELAVMNNAQWAFFLDDDVCPPADTLLKMIKLWKSDDKHQVISGVYWSKSDPSVPLIFRGNLEGSFWDWKTTDIIKADGAGAGCLFVDTNVFKKLSKPWFSTNYFFEDPRTIYDMNKWRIGDQLGAELAKGKGANLNLVKQWEKELLELGENIQKEIDTGKLNPKVLEPRRADDGTTEDLFFFKKVKEELGLDLYVDCSIQCMHQDKRTGRMWGLSFDAPQSKPRYEGRFSPGDQIVLDLGCGDGKYWIGEGPKIRIDSDPAVQPDILCDIRNLPLENCYADIAVASHVLEHFSFRETISVLKEWLRVLKVGGKLRIVVPNMKWASKKIIEESHTGDDMERAMYFYHSAQVGTLKQAQNDFHKAGFTTSSLKSVFDKMDFVKINKLYTTEGNISSMDEFKAPDDFGYNIFCEVEKIRHDGPVSMMLPIKTQREAQFEMGKEPKKEPKSKEVKKPVKKVKKHERKV